jgi:hypothetical protein
MNKKQMILLGLGAVALYLYFRNKPSTSASTPNVAPMPPIIPIPKPKPSPNPRPSGDDLARQIPRSIPGMSLEDIAKEKRRKVLEDMTCSQIAIEYKNINSKTPEWEKNNLEGLYNECQETPQSNYSSIDEQKAVSKAFRDRYKIGGRPSNGDIIKTKYGSYTFVTGYGWKKI